jgi:hypothetical protein
LHDVEKINIKVLELCDENDVFMVLKLLLLTSNPNQNKARFTPDFIHEIVENKDFYIAGVPLVAERNKLESGKTSKLGHGLNKKGQLVSDVIGAFSDFSENEAEDGSWELLGEAKVYKRYPKTCEALIELYESGELSFSCEVMVYKYKKYEDTGIREVDKGNGKLFGQAVVSTPAEVKSKAFLLVSEALNIDLGGDSLAKERNENMTLEEYFSGAKVTLIEKSELDLLQVQRKIYSQMKTQLGDNWWNFDVVELSVNYVIIFDYQNGDYYRMDYSVEGDTLTLGEKYKVSKNYTKIEEVNSEMATIAELEAKLQTAELKIKDLETQIVAKTTEIAQKENELKTKTTELETANATISEKEADIVKLGESITAKDAEIAELTPFKEKVEAAELEKAEAEKVTKRTALTEKCSKILSKDEMETAEMKKAIEDLDENYCNKVLAEKYVANATKPDGKKKTELASRITDNIELSGSEPNSLRAKYSL